MNVDASESLIVRDMPKSPILSVSFLMRMLLVVFVVKCNYQFWDDFRNTHDNLSHSTLPWFDVAVQNLFGMDVKASARKLREPMQDALFGQFSAALLELLDPLRQITTLIASQKIIKCMSDVRHKCICEYNSTSQYSVTMQMVSLNRKLSWYWTTYGELSVDRMDSSRITSLSSFLFCVENAISFRHLLSKISQKRHEQ